MIKKQLVIWVYIGDTVILLTIGIMKCTWKSRSQPTRISRGWDSRTSVSSGGKHRKRRRNTWGNGDLQTAFQKITEQLNSSASFFSSWSLICLMCLTCLICLMIIGFLCWMCRFFVSFHWKWSFKAKVMEHASVQVLEIMQLCVDAFLMPGNLMVQRTVVCHVSFFSLDFLHMCQVT